MTPVALPRSCRLKNDKVRVLIATTNGPVEVLLLTQEDPVIGRSVACIGGTTETADIDAGYDAFVARRTGVIERLFGHPCYRIDFSARVDAGSSWQLGVLLAHALHACGRLAQEGEPASIVIWATGTVRAVDLGLGAVTHVPEKIRLSQARLREERAGGRKLIIAVPGGNEPDVASASGGLDDEGIKIYAEKDATALLGRLGIERAETASVDHSSKALNSIPRYGAFHSTPLVAGVIASVICAVLIIGYLVYSLGDWGSRADPGAAMPLVARLELLSPRERAMRVAGDYEFAKDNKALFISSRTRRWWMLDDERNLESATQRGLEGCYLAWREACVMVAANSNVVSLAPDWPRKAEIPARILYDGNFNVEAIPVLSTQTRKRADVLQYAGVRTPKASAIHPGGIFTIVTGADSPRQAETLALERCKGEGEGTFRPCYLYSSGDQVVLKTMSTEPLSNN
jgi:hypothetical protein